MQEIIQLFGRFHPLIVHLPIGILYLAFIFEFASYFSRFKKLRQAVQPALLFGALTVIAAAISGYLLSQEGGYDDRLLGLHRNTGIATAIFACILYYLRKSAVTYFQDKGKRKLVRIFLFAPLIALLSLAGHLGGSITHGEDYLFAFDDEASVDVAPVFRLSSAADADSAVYYRDVVEPILKSRCYSCHSSTKQKGQLRLDRTDYIVKGGKHGAIINTVIPDSSELMVRLMLPIENEHHMPPEAKSQLSSAEIALIQGWLEEGGSFEKELGSFKQVSKIKGYLSAALSHSSHESLIPIEEVQPADEKAIVALTSMGVMVVPVGAQSNYLSVSFINARSASDKDLELLLPIKSQLLWLNVGRTNITNEGLKTIGQLTTLSQLNLEYTKVGDPTLPYLSGLSKLVALNLVGTAVNNSSLAEISKLPNIKKVYLFQTRVTDEGVKVLPQSKQGIEWVTGGYKMPAFVTDTLVFKSKS